LSETSINTTERGEEIFQTLRLNKSGGNHHKLNDEDYRKLIRLMA
jgi:hypothetical protein